MKIKSEIKEIFFKFLSDSISIEVIKNFFIDNIFEIEEVFSKKDYFKIIEFDYNNKSSIYELEKIINQYIDIAEYHTWKIKNELQTIINNDKNLLDTLLNFYKYYSPGYSFLDNLGHYGCTISCYLEEPEYYDENFIKKDISEKFEEIKQEAEKILRDLNEEKIIIL